MTSTALAYIRVSVVGDRAQRGRFESPDLQRGAIEGWCHAHDVTIADEIHDLNRSGGTLTRPGLTRALEALRDGRADGIVVARSDRASRRALDGLGLIDQLARDGKWIAAADGSIDSTTRTGRMATTMHLAMAQSEYERFKEQSAEIHRRAIADKGRHMGPAPFGYRRGTDGRLEPDPERAPVVRVIFERRADGAGWTQIARDLERQGVRRANGRLVNATQLARMVERRVYVGEASHGDHVKEHAHPPLVDEALFAAANRSRPVVRSSAGVQRKHPESVLRGLVRCAGCRYVMKRLPAPNGTARWLCRTLVSERTATHECGAPARVRQAEYVPLEEHVIALFADLASAASTGRTTTVDVSSLERAAAEAEALLDELSSLDARRALGAARWAKLVAEARAAAEAAAAALATARAQARRGTSDTGRASLADWWPHATLAERQAALSSIIQAVMIVDGDGPIGERVVVVPVWREVELPGSGSTSFVARPFVDE